MAEPDKKSVKMQELLVSSLTQTDALAKLLIEKGLITREDFMKKILEQRATYQKLLNPSAQRTLTVHKTGRIVRKPLFSLGSTVTTTGFRQGDLAPTPLTYDLVSWLVAGMALFLTLALHLLPALLAGLAVYELIQLLAKALKIVRIHDEQGKLDAVTIVALGVMLLLIIAGAGVVGFFTSEAGNLSTLLNKVADRIHSWRTALPSFIAEQLPADVDDLRQTVAWLLPHAGLLKQAGAEVGRTLAHILFGLGMGVLVALYDVQPHEAFGPLARALQDRASRLGEAFRRV